MKKIQPATIKEGDRLKLEVKVTGKPQPTVEWYKDNKRIVEEKRINIKTEGENSTLTIKSSTYNDRGVYKCVATNDSGSVTVTSDVAISRDLKRPEFKEKLLPLLVTEHESTRLNVRVAGNPLPTVEWYKDRTKIENEGRFKLIDDEQEDLFSLVIEDVSKEDADMYKCVAVNEAGKSTCTAELSVKEILFAPAFVGDVETAPVRVTEGDEVNLNVEVKGKPTPKVEWTKDGKPVRETKNISIKSKDIESTVVIKAAKPEDSGHYKCTAKNKQGTSTREFDVIVESKYFFMITILYILFADV